jgi:hypothetical protein
MQRLAVRAFIAGILIAFAFTGCATPTEIVKLHHDKSQSGAPYDKLLVVAIAMDEDGRRRLENLLTDDIASAVPSYRITGLTASVLQEQIDNAAAEVSADGILVTHIVSVDQEAEFTKGRTELKFECRGGDPADYFLYDHEELKLPDDIKVAHSMVTVTNLYSSGNGARIWTIQSTCFDKSSMDDVLQEEAKAIVRQLRHDRLID